ncbi:MAG: HIT domain-containing protein [Rhodothermaceae bacterium]|nr:HIT domain-containing protein [Rhodothermaceae bacterium]
MNHMWSPWRSQHISERRPKKENGSDESVFSRLVREDKDEENLILWRGQWVFVIMNLYPYNNGHLMVVPYREIAQYEDLTTDEQVEVARTIEYCIKWLKSALQPEGFNVGMNLGKAGGAGIPRHLHVHVVPRWNGDTNFMTAVGEIKVIPEALEDTYRKIKAAIDEGT